MRNGLDGAAGAHGMRGRANHALLPLETVLRFFAFSFVIAVLLLIRPVVALAGGSYSDGDWYKVLYQSDLDGYEQYIVSADDRYQAAALICGRNVGFIAGLDDATRKKLATQGGAFQTLAESLDDDFPTWNEDSLEDYLEDTFGAERWLAMTTAYTISPTFPFVGFNSSALSLYTVVEWQETCPTHIFAQNIDPTLRGAASEALRIICDGGSIGGEYDGPVPEGYEVIDAGLGSKTDYLFTMQQYGASANSDSLALDLTEVNGISDIFSLPNYVIIIKQTSSTTKLYFCVTFDNGAIPLRKLSNNSLHLYNPTDNAVSYKVRFGNATLNANTGVYEGQWGGTSSTNKSVNANSRVSFDSSDYSYPYPMNYVCTSNYMGGSGSGGDDEPNPWPDPEPDPPDVPNPPVVNPPPVGGPTLPTDPPADPTPTPEPEPTGTDYTVYLKAIIRQLNQVMVQMSNHCKHIRDQISTSANAIISNLHSFIEDLDESIGSYFTALNDYLEDLTKWFEDFVTKQFDRVINWLSKIHGKMRGFGGGGNTKDIEDDFDIWAWILNQISKVIEGIFGSVVSGVGDVLNSVAQFFPFSLPWDMLNILALMGGVGVTPVFDVTIPAVSGWWGAVVFHIDLHPFDSAAATVKAMLYIVFLMMLASKTQKVIEQLFSACDLGTEMLERMTG